MGTASAVGIDLGTTNSAVACVGAAGRTVMIPNAQGDLLTPSVVLFGDGQVVVGKEACGATTTVPDRVAEWVKRDMGRTVYSKPIRGQFLPPEVIQACILRQLKDDIAKSLGATAKAVITVPAYFDELRRKATADAAEMAGLSILDIVNEPTAAALAFGEAAGYLVPDTALEQTINVLVYDLGGGTFDATLLSLAPGDVRTLATDGDVRLGGHDWDMRLVDHLGETFQSSCGVDPRQDPVALGRLYNAAIDLKHALSERADATVSISHAGHTLDAKLTCAQFEEMTADLLERTAHTTRQLLAEAKLQWKDVSRLLLVGGATRMPMVDQMLRQVTGLAPDRTVNPDEAVARGAALYAKYLLDLQSGESGPAFEVINVSAHSLGVEGIDPETMRKTNVIMIDRNTPLPAKATGRFVTKVHGQPSIVLAILQGESSLPSQCTEIGRTVIRNLPADLPQGSPVDVTFQYGVNGRLGVVAIVPQTGSQAVIDLERDGSLSPQGIARWKRVFSIAGGFDAFEALIEELADTGDLPAPAAETGETAEPLAVLPEEPTDTALDTFLQAEDHRPSRRSRAAVSGPRQLIGLIGWATSAAAGALGAWIFLHWLRPEQFPWPW